MGPDSFATLKQHGLIPTMVPGGGGIKKGINDKKTMPRSTRRCGRPSKRQPRLEPQRHRHGRRPREDFGRGGADNSVAFLNGIKALAEELKVTLCIELLNSKVNHPGYMADHTAWGVEVCKRVNSPQVKLLYDIYHMQIMEGDVIRTIQDNIQYIGHFHTAGNPGRHEFDDTQELNYRAICQAIADLGFQGVLSHEYTPTRDPLGHAGENDADL